jgi:DNA-binding transcriptional LysR family regulator
MELRHIRYFLTIAEEGSFTKAAEKLCIAQPPLSRQIRDLEEELGTPLFVRKARGLALTDAGQRFQQYARRIKQLSDQSIEDIQEMKDGLTGRLYLATVEGHAPELFAKWIHEFKKRYPLVEYEVWNGNSDDVIKRVHAGLNEVGVITLPYDEEGLDGKLVYTEPWVAMIPQNHPLAKEKGDHIHLKKLAPYELIIPSRRSRRKEIENWFAPLKCQPKIICRIAHMLNAYELTSEGVGIAIYPASAAKYISGGVVTKVIQPEVSAGYAVVKSGDRDLSKVAEAFWNMVSDMYDTKKA